MLWGIDISISEEQSIKVRVPILETVSEIFIDLTDLHPENASSPI